MSVDGMLGKEVAMTFQQLSQKLVVKQDCPISQATNYIKTTINLSVVRVANHCLWGSCVLLALMSTRQIPWKDGTGIYLLQSTED
eukprot:14580386-Ditylum_brightwellii.AAC.1